MLRGMSRLTTKSDVLPPLITLLICAMLGGIIKAFVKSAAGQKLLPAVFAVIFLLVCASAALKLWRRTKELLKGRCPNPLCHGVVQRSENVPKGFLICPTCQSKWPEIKGIQFKVTGREHA